MQTTFMFKVLKGFVLASKFSAEVGEELNADKFTPEEITSLTSDGSIEEIAEKPVESAPTEAISDTHVEGDEEGKAANQPGATTPTI